MANTDIITDLKTTSEKYRSEGLALISKADALDVAISVLKEIDINEPKAPVPVIVNSSDYPNLNGLGITAKVIAIIKHVGRFMTRQQIEDTAKGYGSGFKGVIASTLSGDRKKADCELDLVDYGGNKVWGLKSWIVDGKIIDGKEPK